MKFLISITLFLVGCGTIRHSSMERYGLVYSESGAWGSAVLLGNGYGLTASHILKGQRFVLFYGNQIDSLTLVIYQRGELTLFRTSLGRDLEVPEASEVYYTERLLWVQPHSINSPDFKLIILTGLVCHIGREVYVDRGVYPGVSGSGVWNQDGKLVGMMTKLYSNEYGTLYGAFEPIPYSFLDLVRPKVDDFDKPGGIR